MSNLDGSHTSLRTINQQRILTQIVLSGSITRTALIEKSGLTNASVSRITKSLIDARLVIESNKLVPVKGPGRRFVNLTINKDGGYVIGIKINALRQSIVILDLAKNELAKKELNLKSLSSPLTVLKKISEKADVMITRLNLERSRILGVGVAITGVVDSENGILVKAPALGWENIAISTLISEQLNLPVHVENLPNSINLCEHRFGITQDYKSVITINAALGIGSSLIFDNQLIKGSTNSAGVLGQLTFTDSGKYEGKTVDDLTAGWRVLSELKNKSFTQKEHRSAAKKLTNLLKTKVVKSNKDIATSLYKAGNSLGRFIELYIAMTNPDAILLSGPLAECDEYINGVTTRLQENPNTSSINIKILTSQISGSTAAGWLAINEFLIQRPIDLNKFLLKEAA